MDSCFVIQPFDKDKFDKRYTDIFEPAIIAAGLTPYRVDRDPSVRIPIEQIEDGIIKSALCFAEITSDNPNVWYELGYAFARDKDVVMVTEERQKFPFDVQHRQIINYKTSSKSDFELLEQNITDKIKGLLQKRVNVQRIIETPVKESEGLKQHEVALMLILLENQLGEDDTVAAYRLQRDMESAGFTKAAFSLSLRQLREKGLIEQIREYSEPDGEPYYAFKLSKTGDSWILSNEDKVAIRLPKGQTGGSKDDLPF
jgi:predicted transcriptional regulator